MQKYKIILSLSFLVFAVTSLMILTRGKVKSLDDNQAKKDEPKIDMAKLRAEYSENLGRVMGEFEEVAKKIESSTSSAPFADEGFSSTTAREFAETLPTVEKLESLKSDIEGLRAPSADYKDLHLNMMMSVAAMESYVRTLIDEDKAQALEMIEKARENFKKINSL